MRKFSFLKIYIVIWALGAHVAVAYLAGVYVYEERQSLQLMAFKYLYPQPSQDLQLLDTIAHWQNTWQPRLLDENKIYKSERVIVVDDEKKLLQAISEAMPGDSILIEPGTYKLKGKYIKVSRPGESDRPIVLSARVPWSARLELDMLEGFYVDAPYWQFRGLQIVGDCESHSYCEHAFHIVGNGHHSLLLGNRIEDFNAQIKGNGTRGKWPDSVIVEGNSFTNSIPRKTDQPVTPIDVVAANDWRVSNNLIANFKKDGGNRVSYAAFFKGSGSENKFINNLILCSESVSSEFVQVGLSLGGGGTGKNSCRDKACVSEHQDGVLSGNLIANCSDVGIYLNKADQTLVTNNTLYNTLGIDIRYPESKAVLVNNVIGGRISERDGGVVQIETNNWIGPVSSFFGDSFETLFVAPYALDFNFRKELKDAPDAAVNNDIKMDLCKNIYDPKAGYVGALDYFQKANCFSK